MSDKPKKRRAGNDSKPKRKNPSKSTKVRRKQPARKLTKGERTTAKRVILNEMALSIDPDCFGCVQDLQHNIRRAISAVKQDNPKQYEEAVGRVNHMIESLVNYWIKCVPRTWHDFEVELAEE